MEVWVDGDSNFKVAGSPADLMAVFSAVSAFLRERGRMAVEVKLNGASISPTDLQKKFDGVSLDGAKLEVRSDEIRKLVDECLSRLESALSELPQACRQLAEVFQGDAPNDGFEPFQHIAEIWLHIKSQEHLVANALDLDLADGFTVFTGETGAGKSILIDALALTLGERADAAVVREGAPRADITAEFDVHPHVAAWLEAHELHDEIAKTNASFKKVYESMEAFQGAAYPWFRVAELNYDSFMIRHLS